MIKELMEIQTREMIQQGYLEIAMILGRWPNYTALGVHFCPQDQSTHNIEALD
jgi:hypothetical protein